MWWMTRVSQEEHCSQEGPYSHQYSKSRRRPATAHLCLDITIRMFASRYRSCIKGIRTDLHNLNLWHASSKVVLDVLQLPKRPRRNKWIRIYSWIALICMRCGPYALSSHSKETNSHKWIDQTVLQTRHHPSLRESPKAKLERQSNSDNPTDKSEPGL